MSEIDIKQQCQAVTRAGTPCRNTAQPGSRYCHIHLVLAEPTTTNGRGSLPPTSPPPSEDEVRRQLAEELDHLIAQLHDSSPEFTPPPFSPQNLIAALKHDIGQLPPAMRVDLLYRLRDSVSSEQFNMETWQSTWYLMHYWKHFQNRAIESGLGARLASLAGKPLQQLQQRIPAELFDLDTLKGAWFMVSYSVQYQADIIKRRMTGDYQTDDWGLDYEFLDAVRPLISFMYRHYWRVQPSGLENVPDSGRALLVANHSGQLPFDASMLLASVMLDHPSQRLVRSLYANWFPTLPFLSSAFEKIGQTLADVENGTRLLEQEELVGVFPEGYKGVSKLYKDRYKLARFGRGGFIKMALRAQAPIIPVAIVGAEETYISVYKSKTLARLTGFPYFPISLRFPWFGLLGVIPLPTKWYIDFGTPIPIAEFQPDAADDLVLVSQLTDQVRNIVQEMIYQRLAQRRSVFLG